MEVTEGYGLTPRNLRCYDNMVIVTHFVSWSKYDCETQPESMHAIQSRCDGEGDCHVLYTRSVLGDPCPDLSWMRFVMYYSCQTGKISVVYVAGGFFRARKKRAAKMRT